MTKKTRLEKNKEMLKAKEDLKNEWEKFKLSVGGSKEFGKSATNAGIAIIKGVFSIIICIFVIAVTLSIMRGE